MAKITFGPIVSEARNKVGGVVYSRNTHGPYTRAFIVPPYTNTTAQAAARASMAALSQRWSSTLTDEQRAGWRALGGLYPHTDVFRQVNARPGLQTYLRANLALASVGVTAIDTAPRDWNATDPGEISATAASGSPPVITVNASNPPAVAEAVQIWVTPQQSPGANYFYRRMRMVATAPAGTAGPWDPSAGWASRFTTLNFPAKLGVGIRYVNVETGAIGPMRTALITATEGDVDMLKHFQTILTQADILALSGAGVTIVPAISPTKQISFISASLRASFGATGYSWVDPVASNPFLYIKYGPPGTLPAAAVFSAANCVLLFQNGGPAFFEVARAATLDTPPQGLYIQPTFIGTTPLPNIPLILYLDTAFDATFGDPGDTLTIDVWYTELDW